MNVAFWIIAALDAALFTGLIANYALTAGANSSGGREMGIFFFGVVPLIILAIAVLLHVASRAPFWKYVALVIVAGPGLAFAGSRLNGALIDYRVRENALGRGYFSAEPLKSLGAAVVRGDTDTLRRLAASADLNAAGENGMTLLRLAADRADTAATPDQERISESVLATLLELGAHPQPALATALKLKDPTLTARLLAAGANPNSTTDADGPVVFQWLAVMPVENLKALIDSGLDINSKQYQTSLALTTALNRRFDLLLLLAQRGADLLTPRDDGRTIAEELEHRLAEARDENRDPQPEILLIQPILNAQALRRVGPLHPEARAGVQ